jgi:hypothetical protein
MRLIHTINTAIGFKAMVYFDVELSEYVCKFYDGKAHKTDADYFTDSLEDAIETARVTIQYMRDDFALND